MGGMPETTTSRMLSLLNLLQTHRHWAGRELAGRLGVTERTLRRDIERLRGLGYRVESVPGVAGGYRLEAGAALPPLLLTDEEAVTMAIGLRLAASQGISGGPDTTLSALAKLQQVLPPALRARVEALGSEVAPRRLDGSQRPEAPSVAPDVLGTLALACRDHERIRFEYSAADGAESSRVVEPHALVPRSGRWFLVAWDRHREDWRTFRVDRLSKLFPTRVRFEPHPLPAEDAAEFVEVAFGSVPQQVEAEVVMRMPLDRMRAHFGAWSRGAYAETVDGVECTVWPVGGSSASEAAYALVWVPEGVEYTVRGSEELAEHLRTLGSRLLRAVRA